MNELDSMCDLSMYTTDELRAELKRRASASRKQAKKKHERWTYITDVVSCVIKRNSLGHIGLNRYDVITEAEHGCHEFGYSGYRIVQGCGITSKDLPKYGDVVKLRKMNYVNQKHNVFSKWKVCEIVKRKDEQ